MRDFWPTPRVKITSTIPDGLAALSKHPEVLRLETADDYVIADLHTEDAIPSIVADLAQRKVPISSVIPVRPSLEELYFAIRRKHGSTVGELAPPGGGSGRPIRTDESANPGLKAA